MMFLQLISPKSNRWISIASVFVFVSLLVGCSDGSTPPHDLLLDPGDFSNQTVTHSIQEIEDSQLAGAAVLVELTGPDFTLLESLVLFKTGELAAKVLDEIKQDQLAQGVIAKSVEGFDDNSGVFPESLHGESASTLFFVEGNALIRITISGRNHAEKIWEMARLIKYKNVFINIFIFKKRAVLIFSGYRFEAMV